MTATATNPLVRTRLNLALTDVLLPTIAKGIIMRRPGVMALAE